MNNGPELWGAILRLVDDPSAVIAGGCIRDFYLGVAPKDIDIFVSDPALTLGVNIADCWEVSSCYAEYKQDQPNDVVWVREGEMFGHSINLICRKSLATSTKALLDTFDFGILQVAYDKQHRVINTQTQRYDRQHGIATMTHDNHVATSSSRFFRFNRRNPGRLGLVVPFEYQFDG